MAARVIVKIGSMFISIEVLTGPMISRPANNVIYATASAKLETHSFDNAE
jgi:hypothetical protein